MTKYSQVLRDEASDDHGGPDKWHPLWDAVDAAEKDLDRRRRILVRPSGTDPLVPAMSQAETH
jgi:Phosphomannomutase